ncbi:hypothetical protein OHS70_37740 [Streptomyces sp. NBC_00390]|uniref:hypothetical protein n=1 Tax=Streptomyces sp. NBC_00390 TaxID=2975736 RepID=UPI002E205FF3
MELTGMVWGASPEERHARYPCDEFMDGPHERWTRAVHVAASPELVFRWVEQLRQAPYSYDWIDFRGNRSPDRLPDHVVPLEAGQPFMPFRIARFEAGRHITGVLPEEPARRYGQMAVTYLLEAAPRGCRLVVAVDVEKRPGPVHRMQRRLLAWGDVVMMRKQLLTLKRLAERDAAEMSGHPGQNR